jgi:hypothetical protein
MSDNDPSKLDPALSGFFAGWLIGGLVSLVVNEWVLHFDPSSGGGWWFPGGLLGGLVGWFIGKKRRKPKE